MFGKTIVRSLLAAVLAVCGLASHSASAQSDPVGYLALLASFSTAGLPAPGSGVVVEQSKRVNSTPPYAYLPDYTQSQFSGVTFYAGSGLVSGHAATVAREFYGTYGYASGISQVYVYEANSWVANTLGVGSSTGPAPAPAKHPAVANFSWVGSYGDSTDDNDALRRFDSLLWEKAPFLCLSVIFSIIALWMQNKVELVISLDSLPYLKRAANAIVSYAAYPGKMFWPVNLAGFILMIYPCLLGKF